MKDKRIVQVAIVLCCAFLAYHWDNGWVLFWGVIGCDMISD
jgi:hypothetical protein